ncbi:MAG: hypothetical protein GYB68_08890 [Chloroflexi bacterium]|nr:hypothetical protein [Chloroflexota bacterium]
MMTEPLIGALVQVPFVLVMLYLVHRFLSYLDERNHEWQAFLSTTHESLTARIIDLTQAVERLHQLLLRHDARYLYLMASTPSDLAEREADLKR